ncbi:MAG: hypothetical protein KBT02_13520 [Treponema sp.]|nr:hypothetical protein [Candidatus Treponema caballi]
MKSTEKLACYAVLTVLFVFILMLNGCTKAGREADLSDSVNLAASNQWSVVSVPYAAFKSEPSESADVIDHGRRSDYYEIKGKKYVTDKKETILWYQFEKGWLPESSVIVFDNQLKARTAAESMNE